MPKRLRMHRPHQFPPLASHAADERTSSCRRGYDRKWRAFRLWFLAGNPLCVFCQEQGRLISATQVDHIQTLASGGARLDPANCRALCHSCHSKRTAGDRAKGS